MAAVHLPYGLQRRVEFARALAAAPRLILLDEPTAGMNVDESDQIVQLIRGLLDLEVTVLLVEHDMRVVMGACSEVWVMNYGRIIARGSPQQIRNDPLVIEAYLGEQA
jgi:branched-chain amino acid transport system ATP-binding protein